MTFAYCVCQKVHQVWTSNQRLHVATTHHMVQIFKLVIYGVYDLVSQLKINKVVAVGDIVMIKVMIKVMTVCENFFPQAEYHT